MIPKFVTIVCLLFALSSLNNCLEKVDSDHHESNPWTAQRKHFFQDFFDQRHSYLLNVTKDDSEKIKIIFLGDSITNAWDSVGNKTFQENFVDLGVYNYGIGADLTQNVLWRIQEGEFDGLTKLKAVFLMIGTNNISMKDKPKDIAKGIETIIEQLKKKHVKRVYLLSVLPRVPDSLDRAVHELNGLISKLANTDSVRYIDLTPFYETSLGHQISNLFQPDNLHLSAAGYEVWAAHIKASVQEALQ